MMMRLRSARHKVPLASETDQWEWDLIVPKVGVRRRPAPLWDALGWHSAPRLDCRLAVVPGSPAEVSGWRR